MALDFFQSDNTGALVEGCGCHRCVSKRREGKSLRDYSMLEDGFRYACIKCGNKRCPHHSDHRNHCTGSNEPGQPGSDY